MSQRKLLLADDSMTIQKVVNLTFAAEGIEVITVGDGDSAMEKWRETAPDLVMADVNMPGLSGYEVCEKIKQSGHLKKTPVILLVGSFEPFDEAEAERIGADGFLTKPFQSIRQLVSKVTELLAPASNGENATSTEFVNAPPDNSFADIQEFVPYDYAPLGQGSVQFGDAGMDDQMIQTNQPSSFALDESPKFETKEIFEPAEDTAKNNALADDEEKLISRSSAFGETQKIAVAPITQVDSLLGADEDDLLELPFIENETEDERGTATETTALSEGKNQSTRNIGASRKTADVSSARQRRSLISSNETVQLSPETIDAIAQKFVEKISDKAIREIAWKVVPQLADLIVRKMSEEKPD